MPSGVLSCRERFSFRELQSSAHGHSLRTCRSLALRCYKIALPDSCGAAHPFCDCPGRSSTKKIQSEILLCGVKSELESDRHRNFGELGKSWQNRHIFTSCEIPFAPARQHCRLDFPRTAQLDTSIISSMTRGTGTSTICSDVLLSCDTWGMSMMTLTISSKLCGTMTSTISSLVRCSKRFWICDTVTSSSSFIVLWWCAAVETTSRDPLTK